MAKCESEGRYYEMHLRCGAVFVIHFAQARFAKIPLQASRVEEDKEDYTVTVNDELQVVRKVRSKSIMHVKWLTKPTEVGEYAVVKVATSRLMGLVGMMGAAVTIVPLNPGGGERIGEPRARRRAERDSCAALDGGSGGRDSFGDFGEVRTLS